MTWPQLEPNRATFQFFILGAVGSGDDWLGGMAALMKYSVA
jgi:hypothetical protein